MCLSLACLLVRLVHFFLAVKRYALVIEDYPKVQLPERILWSEFQESLKRLRRFVHLRKLHVLDPEFTQGRCELRVDRQGTIKLLSCFTVITLADELLPFAIEINRGLRNGRVRFGLQ